MNRPLRRVAFAVLVLLGLLLVNVNYLQAIQAEELNSRSDNSRVLLREYSRERGAILVGGGRQPVAQSVETDDELKYLRRYPAGPLYAPVTGYYSFVYGREGIERTENPVLTGEDGRLFVRRLAEVIGGRDAQGGSVALTINPRAQQAAAAGLQGKRGAVVALNPSTGEILAMASSPSYDPNLLATHNRARATAAWERLNEDSGKPLLNRTIRQTYPPGSTFKLVTAAAALSTGRYTPESTLPGPAALDLPQTTASLPNSDGQPCSPGSSTTTLENALRRSCNSTFGALALQVGDDAIREQAEKFGFGRELSVPLPAVGSVYPADLNPPQTAQSGIGQFDVRATPLQMAMVAAGIANGGRVMQPRLVSQVLAPDLSVVSQEQPQQLANAVSAEVAAQLTSMMVTVVEEGTGSNARLPNVRVAGKTGTAQQGENRPPHAWFVSFAPADDARVAVAVVIEDGGGAQEISGNRLAAPIAREVMRAVLQ